MRKIIIYATLLIIFGLEVGCGIFGPARRAELARAPANQTSHLALGYLEGRDLDYNPFLVRNFRDMLVFELLKREKRVALIDPAAYAILNKNKETRSSLAPAHPQINAHAEKSSNSMLPPGLRHSAGEHPSISPRPIDVSQARMLSSDEIRRLIRGSKTRWYLQGSVSRNRSGDILKENENTFIFMSIHDRNGIIAASIRLAIRGESLLEADVLQDITQRMAKRIVEATERR